MDGIIQGNLMKNLSYPNCIELKPMDLLEVQGGGPIKRAIQWYYLSVGSFYRGIYDGLSGNDPIT